MPLVLSNESSRGCYLDGYPGVLLVDRSGQGLPVLYLQTGDQVVTSAPPQHVDLPPGAEAFLTVSKPACAATGLTQAAYARVTLPDDTSSLQITIAGNVPMDYCGAGDPGSVLHISPVEPTYAATLQQG